MNSVEVVESLNAQWPPSVKTVGGQATGYDPETKTLSMSFEAKPMFCHSVDIVQGGYITGMLDAAMAYTVIGPSLVPSAEEVAVATLEIKVNFISSGNSGPMTGTGTITHLGRSIGFISGELYQGDRLIATATSTVKLLRMKK